MTITEKLDSLLSASNATTGVTDIDLTGAVSSLVAGYGVLKDQKIRSMIITPTESINLYYTDDNRPVFAGVTFDATYEDPTNVECVYIALDEIPNSDRTWLVLSYGSLYVDGSSCRTIRMTSTGTNKGRIQTGSGGLVLRRTSEGVMPFTNFNVYLCPGVRYLCIITGNLRDITDGEDNA